MARIEGSAERSVRREMKVTYDELPPRVTVRREAFGGKPAIRRHVRGERADAFMPLSSS